MNLSAHRPPDPTYHTILVPLDGSDFANGALPTARALAARFAATIHTVTVAVARE
jgi:nucleotide-binding universal stress UspA family protein